MEKTSINEAMPDACLNEQDECGCGESCRCASEGDNCNGQQDNDHCQNGKCGCHHAAADDKSTTEDKLSDIQDKYLRLMAEFANFRKRNARERVEMAVFAGQDIIQGLLPVVDDLERAVKAAKTAADDAVAAPLLEGVQLICQKLLDYLKSKGLQEIDTAAGDFDTDVHDAVTKFPAACPEQKGKIIDVIQKGYKLHDKVIRFAKVVVGE